MGKSKKGNKIVASFRSTQGLEEQITEGRVAKTKNKNKEKIHLRYEDEDSEFIDPKTTQRILKAAQKQRAELADEFGPTPAEAKSRGLFEAKKSIDSDGDSESDHFDDDGGKEEYTEHDFFDDLKMNDEDEKALQMFQKKLVFKLNLSC